MLCDSETCSICRIYLGRSGKYSFISCVKCNVVLLKADTTVTMPVFSSCVWTGLRLRRTKSSSPYWTVYYHSPVQYRSLRGKYLYFSIFWNNILTSAVGHQSSWPPLSLSVIDIKWPAHTIYSLHPNVITEYRKMCVISTFRREVDQDSVLLGNHWSCTVQTWTFVSEFINVTLCIPCRYAQ